MKRSRKVSRASGPVYWPLRTSGLGAVMGGCLLGGTQATSKPRARYCPPVITTMTSAGLGLRDK
ncbi:hypothetical protein D3C85_431030 [compost metagenome]